MTFHPRDADPLHVPEFDPGEPAEVTIRRRYERQVAAEEWARVGPFRWPPDEPRRLSVPRALVALALDVIAFIVGFAVGAAGYARWVG